MCILPCFCPILWHLSDASCITGIASKYFIEHYADAPLSMLLFSTEGDSTLTVCCGCVRPRHTVHILTLHEADYTVKNSRGFSGAASHVDGQHRQHNEKRSYCVARKKLFSTSNVALSNSVHLRGGHCPSVTPETASGWSIWIPHTFSGEIDVDSADHLRSRHHLHMKEYAGSRGTTSIGI